MTEYSMPFGSTKGHVFTDPIGFEVRGPLSDFEKASVRVVDTFFNKIGVKTR